MTSFLYLNIYYYAEIYWGKNLYIFLALKEVKKLF